jgi:hypothetical protein
MDRCVDCTHWTRIGKKNSKTGQCMNKNSFFYKLFLHYDCIKTHCSGCYDNDLFRGDKNSCPIQILGR